MSQPHDAIEAGSKSAAEIEHDQSELQCPANIGEPRLSKNYVLDFFGEPRGQTLLCDAGFRDGLNDSDLSITGQDFWKLCIADLAIHNDEAHGCACKPLPRFTGGMLFAAINEMDTVKDGLQLLTTLLDALPAGIEAKLGFAPKSVSIHYRLAPPEGETSRGDRFLEMFALVVHCVLRWGTSLSFRPTMIRRSDLLADRDGSLLEGLSERWHRQGSGVTVQYDRTVLALRLGVRKYRFQDKPELSAFLDITRDHVTGTRAGRDNVVDLLRALLLHGPTSKSRAAAALGMSAATLQRRLGEAGTSYCAISKELRQAKLQALLATDQALDDIALELGFSDRRALWRASHHWLGMSPTQYRSARSPMPALSIGQLENP